MTRVPLALLLFLAPPAWSASTGTDELLSTSESVPPTIIFVVDRSMDMASACDGGTGDSCLSVVLSAIGQVARHFPDAKYGVIGTAEDPADDTYFPIAPVGSSYAEIAAALSTVSVTSGTTRNLGEVLEDAAENYLSASGYDNGVDDDGDGMTGDWSETPIGYSCSDTHFVVFAKDRPVSDEQISSAYASESSGTSTEVACDSAGLSTVDVECIYDNVAAHLYNSDLSSLSDTQRVIVHTISLGVSPGSIAESLFDNAVTNTVGEGLYTNATTESEVLGGILSVMSEVMAGVYSRSAPVVSVTGDYLIYTFYEMTGDNPLAQGHVQAFEIDDDPASATYGEVLYDGPEEYGGAVWDGGHLLVSRPVTSGESNPEDHDGIGPRDIYTFEDYAFLLPALRGEVYDADATTGRDKRRIGFDAEFAQAVGASAATLDLYMESASTTLTDCDDDERYDLNRDCGVDGDDLQALIDFTRGLPDAQFRYLDMERGRWKLGDSPYSIPVVVSPRDDHYSTDSTYREFLSLMESSDIPSIVLLAANDGMLHAFRLEDDPDTASEDEAGQELWAWIPGYLLLRDKPEEWSNSLVDLMWYGRTFLFDGSPVVDDVWIDSDGDGMKTAEEWRRVVVVQQGFGGPVTLALDITDTRRPEFLWEQVNPTDSTAQGYGTGRPAILNAYDTGGTAPHDQWVAVWGGGRAVGYTSPTTGNSYWRSSEANLYMWNMGDDAWGTESVGYEAAGDNIGAKFPDEVSMGGGTSSGDLNYDTDSMLENGYISAALAAVDVDADGDGDVLYFPVSSSYRPTDEGGGGVSDPQDPGSSWMYKAILNSAAPDDFEWCMFYDPMKGTDGTNGVGARPEVHYAATTAWLPDGTLGVYWGTGTPFSRDGSDTGYFFAMYDQDPRSCTSTAQPIPCNGNDGYYPLEAGEGLTGDPLVYAGVVYFPTYTPDADRCELGVGRIYGLAYDTCGPGMDTNGVDGVTPEDSPYEETSGYVSNVSVGEGAFYYGSTGDGSGPSIGTIRAPAHPFLGSFAIAWMEVY